MSDEITNLKKEVAILRSQLDRVQRQGRWDPYASPLTQQDWSATSEVPAQGLEPNAVRALVENTHGLDFDPKLNTSSYVNVSFEEHPYRVALIWRFSPLPEFVKNVGPALVPTLRTRYQLLAILTHGLPFTVLWSCMGSEAARVARGGQASVLLKRMVAVISWVGLFVSPTAFGWWIKGLGGSSEEENAVTESG